MNTSILATKLCCPLLRQDRVPRVRLIERLNAGLWQPAGFVRKLTLVSAPAGFGKTTLVSEWLTSLQLATNDSGVIPGKNQVKIPILLPGFHSMKAIMTRPDSWLIL